MKTAAIAAALAIALWSALAMALSPYNRALTMQSGELLAAAISGATGGTAATVLTLSSDCAGLTFENTTPAEMTVNLNGTKFKRVPSGAFRSFDFGANEARIVKATTIGVYPSGGTGPVSGAFEVICVPAF